MIPYPLADPRFTRGNGIRGETSSSQEAGEERASGTMSKKHGEWGAHVWAAGTREYATSGIQGVSPLSPRMDQIRSTTVSVPLGITHPKSSEPVKL